MKINKFTVLNAAPCLAATASAQRGQKNQTTTVSHSWAASGVRSKRQLSRRRLTSPLSNYNSRRFTPALAIAVTFIALIATAFTADAQNSHLLSVRADNAPGTVVEDSAASGPVSVDTGPSTGTGGTSQGSGTANYGFLQITASGSTSGNGGSHSLFAAQGSAKFTDTVTIDVPGRTGTRGRVTFKARYFGRISAVGAHGDHMGFHRARAQIDYSAHVGECCEQGTLSQGFEIEGDGTSTNYNFLGQVPGPEFSGEFTFGVPFEISLEISGGAFTYIAGPQSANVEMGASWQGAVRVEALSDSENVTGYTVSSQSGANYAKPITSMTPGAQPDSADLVVTVTDGPDPVADGGHVTYRTTVRNAGPNTAGGVQGSIIGLNGLFISTTLPPGSFTRLGSSLNVNLGDLASGAETSFDIVLAANQPVDPNQPAEMKFSAAFTSNAVDPDAANNSVSVTTAFSGAPPIAPYYLDRVIQPPEDFSSTDGYFVATAMNAQAYVAFDYVADTSDANSRRIPLIFKNRDEPFIALTWPGDLNPPAGERPHIAHISDLAQDGSFWVVGTYVYDRSDSNLNYRPMRGVAWHVDAEGRSTVYRLENLYTSVGGNPPFEEQDAYPTAINSSGVAVGYGHQTAPLGTQVHLVGIKWKLPSATAHRLSTETIRIGHANDIDEAGNFVGFGYFEDRSYIGGFYNLQPLPMASDRGNEVEAIANGRLTGWYDFGDSEGPNGPFVYTVGDPALRRLPKPAGTMGDTSTESSGDSGKHINAAGDIVGTASNPPSIGNSHNPSYQVLWKRRADGSYRVYTLESILQQSNKGGSEYRFAELVGIADDGTILLKNTISGRSTHQFLRPGERPTNQPLNIATRMLVQSGDDVLIGGMIVTGPEYKTVVIRAIGPSLTELGVPSALQDPVLELYENGELSVTNDNWRDIEFFFEPGQPAAGFAPRHDLESAIVTTLVAGQSYTAVVRSNGEPGIGVVEVYDLSRGTDAQLANISTRGRVETGDDVMIAGFILGGSSQVLIRALGPSLAEAGVTDALENPTLELFDNNGTPIAFNDDWRGGETSALPAGFEPRDEREAAIVASLGAGPYTAVVRGILPDGSAGTGVALVEVYNLQ